jgi:excisionase family DNA binding protein
MEVTISEAVRLLRVSDRTIRRRIRNGELRGRQVSNPGGFAWMVEVPDDLPEGLPSPDENGATALIKKMEAHITSLETHITSLEAQLVAKDKQISELHVLLQQTQAALPAPGGRPWWKWWRR